MNLRHLSAGSPVAPARVVTFRVFGIAQAKGSTRAFLRGTEAIVTADNPSLAKWESAIRFAAATVVERAGGQLFDGGVSVALAFYLPRPRSVTSTRRPFPVTRPDLDKAARAVLDPLTGILYHDDAQVIDLHATKLYTDGPACVEVTIRAVTTPDQLHNQ